MKQGLSASLFLHVAALGFGLFSLSAPKAFDVADVESLPVDMVSISEFSQIMRGDRKAPPAETPAPRPTEKKDQVQDAVNIGDNLADLDNPPTPAPRPVKVDTAAARAEPEPAPAPRPEPEPEPEPVAEPAPAVPEPAPKPEPEPVKQEAAPEPEPAPAETPEAEALKLPETAPIPQAKPKREPVQEKPQQVAQKPKPAERSKPETPAREATRSRDRDSELDLDEVAALIDRAKASGGGAKRSEQQAALGNRQDSEAKQLSQSELDALRSQLESCWSPPVGAVGSSEFTASVKFQVDVSRQLSGPPVILRSSGNRQFDDSVIRAVNICNSRGFQLPEGKQSVWADIVVNFDPSGMF